MNITEHLSPLLFMKTEAVDIWIQKDARGAWQQIKEDFLFNNFKCVILKAFLNFKC